MGTKSWIIYKHTNKINNKSYVGLTSRSPEKRRANGHGYTCKSGQCRFAQAIRKYGWDNFDHTILEENITTLEQASARERYWITFYDSYLHGYNMSPGGSGWNDSCKRAVLQIDNTYTVVAEFPSVQEAADQIHLSAANLSDCCRDVQKTFGGYYWCYKEDYYKWSPPQYRSTKIPVYQIDMNTLQIIRRWEGIKDAEVELSISHAHISDCCHYRRRQTGGYYWCFVYQFENWSPKPIIAHPKRVRHPVVRVETNVEYESYRGAAKACGGYGTDIRRAVQTQRLYKGVHWRDIKYGDTKIFI